MPDAAAEGAACTDGYQVESKPGTCLFVHSQEITRGIHKVRQLKVCNGCEGVNKCTRLPCAHLHENNNPFFQGHDIDLTRRADIIAFQDAVTAKKKVDSR